MFCSTNLVHAKKKSYMSKSTVKGKTLHCARSLFADDAALVANSTQDLQTLLNQFSSACSDFGLTISLKKTKVLGQGTDRSRSMLRISKMFVYLGSSIASNASLDKEINCRIGKANYPQNI